jgi:molybdenum cofactor biosynthesis protein B
MTNHLDERPVRCLVATVALGRASVRDDVTQVIVDELRAGGCQVVRSVTVHREKLYIRQLMESVAAGNEADAVVFVGGAGIGPRDYACEVIDELADRRIEGYGEEYRRILREGERPVAKFVLTRATAGIYNNCIAVAMPRQAADVVRRAVQRLLLPVLPEALRIITGAGHALS